MPTTTRQHGTKVTVSATPAERIEAIRAIVASGQYAKVDGYMVDGFSASAIVKVYDALSPVNQAKFSALSLPRMSDIAFQMVTTR